MRIKNTPIVFDEFTFYEGAYVYLLSHIHTDHTGGLSPSWNNGIIYCTEVTKQLIMHKFGVKEEVIKSIPVGKNVPIPLDGVKGSCMEVTALEANHCVGAIMFHCVGYFGTLFITGDFRFDPFMLQHPLLTPNSIDHLFLDDTFLEKGCEFQSRQVVGSEILEYISSLDHDTNILVKLDTFGKEELLIAMAQCTESLVHVSHERMQILKILSKYTSFPDIFTEKESEARIVVVTKPYLVKERRLQFMNRFRKVVAVVPSGWAGGVDNKSCGGDPDGGKLARRFGYSLHSSFSEIVKFVDYLHPRCITSTSKKDNTNIEKYLTGFLNTCEPARPGGNLTLPTKFFDEAALSELVPQCVRVSMGRKQRVFITPYRSETLAKSTIRKRAFPSIRAAKRIKAGCASSPSKGADVTVVSSDSEVEVISQPKARELISVSDEESYSDSADEIVATFLGGRLQVKPSAPANVPSATPSLSILSHSIPPLQPPLSSEKRDVSFAHYVNGVLNARKGTFHSEFLSAFACVVNAGDMEDDDSRTAPISSPFLDMFSAVQ